MLKEGMPLTTYRDLIPARQVPHPEQLTPNDLTRWRDIARGLCADDFNAIAFNQIPGESLGRMGFGGMKPSVIYLNAWGKNADALQDTLIINPKTLVKSVTQLVIEEGCGSIRDENGIMPRMFILRPETVIAGAHIWKPGDRTTRYIQFTLGGLAAAIYDHEADHLDGLTALSRPWDIIDIRNKKLFKKVLAPYDADRRREIRYSVYAKNAIVYDARKHRLLRVSISNDVLEEYTDIPVMTDYRQTNRAWGLKHAEGGTQIHQSVA